MTKQIALQLPELPLTAPNYFINILQASKGEEKTRSPFEIGEPLNHILCLVMIGQSTNEKIEINIKKKIITNNALADTLLVGSPLRKNRK